MAQLIVFVAANAEYRTKARPVNFIPAQGETHQAPMLAPLETSIARHKKNPFANCPQNIKWSLPDTRNVNR